MEFLSDYGLFLAKAITIVVALLFVVSSIASLRSGRALRDSEGHIDIKSLNDRFRSWEDQLHAAVLGEHGLKARLKARKKQQKQEAKARKKQRDEDRKPRIYVLEFDGDIKASAVDKLRREVSAVLTVAEDRDEVLVCVESPGGLVHGYGLAASQLKRVRDHGVQLTVAVDKVAASGGYMMACIADRIVAAPFAVIGSIGVMAQLPNFHRLLKKHDIDVELHTAGEYKRTLTVFGENTEKGRQKFLDDLEDTHQLFKQFVKENRPQLDMDAVATGEYWYGSRALERQLIDEISTSDSYLLQRREQADLFRVSYVERKRLPEKIGLSVESALERTLTRWLGLLQNRLF